MNNIKTQFNKSKKIIYYLKKKTHLIKYIIPKQSYYSINIDNNNSNINLLNYFQYNNNTNIESSNVIIIIKSNKNIYYNNNIYLRIVLTPLFVSPIILIGTLLSRILPSDNKLYLNNVIFCKKVNNLNNN